ncbi:homoserine dehydrogenase [Collinsella bouchesdurhonensis]|uniref:homoserine dehydrogenase n=1 Tax=Collinsella bouchesdurhonensis TaxID=1907654 RepID=UPI002A7BF4C1|nr:homoserine dehydrogenase [Collinsella bouchesdurhonensis]MDY3052891.1 homoserine dehydrogenase [Collinsella bouchesdurhonensis]
MQDNLRTVNVGLIGLGTVGGGVARTILSHHDRYLDAYNIDLKIARACGLVWEQAEAAGITPEQFTSDWHDVVSDENVDIVVELIGGEHPATEIYEAAFAAGKHVVTANKALLGRHVEAFARAAREHGVQLKCEASCGGGIPIVSTLERDLVGNEILTIAGILNGTTNYILSRMEAEGADYADVLADAQAKGYAEADPSADVDGFDAASKTAILASIGFSSRVTTDDVYQQGIRTISAEDISVAHDLGYTIKLLGIARNTAEGVDVRVHPTMIPLDHQLAKVSGAMNAVYVVGDAVGETMFYGAGAGSFPTASAVVGDILTLSEQISRGVAPLPESEPFSRNKPIRSMDELETKYYIRLRVADRVGALAEAVNVFAKHDISISLINQLEDGNSDSDACSVIFLTHKALEKNVQDAAAALAASDCVSEVANVLRIEDVDAWTDGVMAN